MIDALKRLRPEEALAFFRAKGLAPPDARFDYRDVWRNEHASNFVVAKAMRDEVLETIRGALDRALEGGGTLASFMDELEPELKRLGWWGRGMERDPLTGALKNVQLGSPRRLRVIFDANMRAAHAAGKWARIERVKDAFPFLRYVQIQRDTKREEHARYHDLIRPVDDPVWERIYPPNGWRCGCTVQQLSQAMMDRRGMSVTEDFTLKERGVLNKRTGQIEPTALGVDPAWDGNPGKAWLDLGGRHGPISGGLPSEAAATELGFVSRARLLGMTGGRGHLGALDLATGNEIDWSIEAGDRAGISSAMRAALAAAPENVGLVRNLSGAPALGADDIGDLLATRAGSLLGVTVDGTLARAVLARDTTLSRAALDALARRAQDLALGLARGEEAELIARLALTRALRRSGAVVISERLGPATAQTRARLEASVARIAGQLSDGI